MAILSVSHKLNEIVVSDLSAASRRLSGEATPAISSHFVAYQSNILISNAESETDNVSQKNEVDEYLEIDDDMGREDPLSNTGHKEKESEGGGSDRARVEEIFRWDKRDAEPIHNGTIGGAQEGVNQDVDMNHSQSKQNDKPVSPQPTAPRPPVNLSTTPQPPVKQPPVLSPPVEQPPLTSQPPAKQPVEPQPHVEKRKRKEVDYNDMQGQIKRPKYQKVNLGDSVAGQGSQREQGPRWERLEDDILVNFSSLCI